MSTTKRKREVAGSEKNIENAALAEKKESEEVRDTVDEQNDDSKYPGGGKLAILTFGLCMATFVVALDNTIIATAIPRITTVFDSLNDVGWYGSSYLLTTTSLQPSFGKIYTYFNIKWTYITALLIFELGSIVCAAAKNSVMLIVGRAIAGAGAAALFSGGMTIVGFSVALRKRALYISLLSSMFGISSVVGPILGGVLTDRASWRWCFWINLPFGGVALLTVFLFFKNPERAHTGMTLKQKINQIDIGGAFLLICGIVCLLLALQWGGNYVSLARLQSLGLYPWIWSHHCMLHRFAVQAWPQGYHTAPHFNATNNCSLRDLHHLLIHGVVRTYLLSPILLPGCQGDHSGRLRYPNDPLSGIDYYCFHCCWWLCHCLRLVHSIHVVRRCPVHCRCWSTLQSSSLQLRWEMDRVSISCWHRRWSFGSDSVHCSTGCFECERHA